MVIDALFVLVLAGTNSGSGYSGDNGPANRSILTAPPVNRSILTAPRGLLS